MLAGGTTLPNQFMLANLLGERMTNDFKCVHGIPFDAFCDDCFAGKAGTQMAMAPRNGSQTFYALLEECANIHDKKSHDYANNDDPYGNYRFAGFLASMFSHSPDDAGFVGRIGEKIYRLANLERDGKVPLNESVEDTERDIVVICALWMSARKDKRRQVFKPTSSCTT